MPAPQSVSEWSDEVAACISDSFRFLEREHGYAYAGHELLAAEAHAIRVMWRRDGMCVVVFADQFRNELDVSVIWKPGEKHALNLSVGDLALMFGIPGFSTRLGLTTPERRRSITKLAEMLRAYGNQAIEGDEGVFRKAAESRRERLEDANQERAFTQALLDGRAAWTRRDYAAVVAALGPFSEHLSNAEATRLQLARSRVAKPDSDSTG